MQRSAEPTQLDAEELPATVCQVGLCLMNFGLHDLLISRSQWISCVIQAGSSGKASPSRRYFCRVAWIAHALHG